MMIVSITSVLGATDYSCPELSTPDSSIDIRGTAYLGDEGLYPVVVMRVRYGGTVLAFEMPRWEVEGLAQSLTRALSDAIRYKDAVERQRQARNGDER